MHCERVGEILQQVHLTLYFKFIHGPVGQCLNALTLIGDLGSGEALDQQATQAGVVLALGLQQVPAHIAVVVCQLALAFLAVSPSELLRL